MGPTSSYNPGPVKIDVSLACDKDPLEAQLITTLLKAHKPLILSQSNIEIPNSIPL